MFPAICGSIGLFCECAMNDAIAMPSDCRRQKSGSQQPAFSIVRLDRAGAQRQQVALPQRATPIFSFRLSTPTAPITTCLPIT